MSKQTYFQRYSLIINRLERGPATFEQIADYLIQHSESEGEDFTISIRTLQRDIKDIQLQMKYEIQNERKGDKRYQIISRPEDSDTSKRLLENYHLINIINSSDKFKDFVFLESRKAQGIEHFHVLLNAIRKKLGVTFTYQKFSGEDETTRHVHPLALKEAIGRWYLAAVDTKDNELKTFGLDRMSLLDVDEKPHRTKYDFDIKNLFHHAFGVVNDTTQKPEKVKLAFTYKTGKYVTAYPLHHSQKEIKQNAAGNEVIIELFLVVAYDFIKEILSHGDQVKVLQPAWLKKEVKAIAGRVSTY